MTAQYNKKVQASRYGKSAITIYVKPEYKEAIRLCLIKSGYGWSYQEGITNLLNELLRQNGYSECIDR